MTKKAGDCWHQTSTKENKTRMAEFQRDMCLVSMLLRGDGDWLYAHQARTTVSSAPKASASSSSTAGQLHGALTPFYVSDVVSELSKQGSVAQIVASARLHARNC